MMTMFSYRANFGMLPPRVLRWLPWAWQPRTDPCLSGTARKTPTGISSSCSPSLCGITVRLCAFLREGPRIRLMRRFLLIWESFRFSFQDLHEGGAWKRQGPLVSGLRVQSPVLAWPLQQHLDRSKWVGQDGRLQIPSGWSIGLQIKACP